jgi:peroxiredoxin
VIEDAWPDAPWGLKIGEHVPQFTAKAIDNTNFVLENVIKEKRAIILFFFRGTW